MGLPNNPNDTFKNPPAAPPYHADDPLSERLLEGLWEKVRRHAFGVHQHGSFELRPDGVYHTNSFDGKAYTEKICSWLDVAARSRDENSKAWGKVLRWTDHDGGSHQWSTPASFLVKGGTELVEMLASDGLDIVHGKGARVKEYIDTVQPSARRFNVPRTGWYTVPRTTARVFVLPDRVIGETPGTEGVVFQPESYTNPSHRIVRAGSVEEWQKHVGAFCVGNNILAFAASLGFAAPVLELLNEQSGGFHIRGGSSQGKTTALAVAASVWGYSMENWRTTDNELENIAERHNHVLLALDELSQLDPRKAIDVAYMLGNGDGKGRSSPSSASQRKREWRLLFLSTGELSLVDHAASVGMKPKAGTEMRMVEINSDAGKNAGIFEFLHGYEKPSELADHLLKHATAKFRGTAGPMWVEWLIAKQSDALAYLKKNCEMFVERMVPTGASGEIERVARRFAVVGTAAELATDAGITGWQSGVATCAAQWCFKRWMSNRPTQGSSDLEKAIAHLRAFLQTNGDSRFDVIGDGFPRHVTNRAGYRHTGSDGETEYLVIPEVFESEVKQYFDPTKVAQELDRRGWLRTEPGRLKVQQRIPGLGKPRFYAVQSGIFADGDDHPKG